MKWSELLIVDKEYKLDLKLCRSHIADPEIKGLGTFDCPAEQVLMFIKSKKYWQRFVEKMSTWSENDLKGSGILFSDNFFVSLKEEDIPPHLGFIATTSSIEMAMVALSRPFYEAKYLTAVYPETVVHPTAIIEQGANISPRGVVIGPHVQIMNGATIMSAVTIGEGSIIFPNVTLYPHVEIGRHCRIHAGTVIGADGFGYQFKQGVHHKIWQLGGVKIGNDVEVGSNTCIDSGTFSPTLIGNGCKIDNQVQIGHNCRLGQGVILCGHVGLAGSVKVGNYCVFGGYSGAAPDITLGDGCQIAGGSLINCDWPAGSTLGGYPARPVKEWMRSFAWLRRESLRENKN